MEGVSGQREQQYRPQGRMCSVCSSQRKAGVAGELQLSRRRDEIRPGYFILNRREATRTFSAEEQGAGMMRAPLTVSCGAWIAAGGRREAVRPVQRPQQGASYEVSGAGGAGTQAGYVW